MTRVRACPAQLLANAPIKASAAGVLVARTPLRVAAQPAVQAGVMELGTAVSSWACVLFTASYYLLNQPSLLCHERLSLYLQILVWASPATPPVPARLLPAAALAAPAPTPLPLRARLAAEPTSAMVPSSV